MLARRFRVSAAVPGAVEEKDEAIVHAPGNPLEAAPTPENSKIKATLGSLPAVVQALEDLPTIIESQSNLISVVQSLGQRVTELQAELKATRHQVQALQAEVKAPHVPSLAELEDMIRGEGQASRERMHDLLKWISATKETVERNFSLLEEESKATAQMERRWTAEARRRLHTSEHVEHLSQDSRHLLEDVTEIRNHFRHMGEFMTRAWFQLRASGVEDLPAAPRAEEVESKEESAEID